jgi:arylsulfatase A
MYHRRCLLTLLPFLIGFSVSSLGAANERQPNVILIMADDLGYETIGANGGTSYRTPVLDRLAATGVRFDQCYVQPLCTPTRVQLMTGAYNVRNYVRFGYLDPSLKTFGNLFRDAGYATGIVGKWQLGGDKELPKHFGFEEHCLWQLTRRPPRYANPGLEIDGVEKDFTNGEYGPKLVNDYALEFITRHRDERFLLYYPMILTHSPYQATPKSASWDAAAKGESVNVRDEHFGDMVEYMDDMVGRLVYKLDALNIRDNTLLIFVGDNGTGKGTKSFMGDKLIVGGKGTTTAAGMHVPCVVNWPGKVKAGHVSSALVDSTDFLPSICDAAQIQIPASMTIDGHSMVPYLRGEETNSRQWIYSWYSPRQSDDMTVREFAFDHQFKLYRNGDFFDLVSDRAEKNSLAVDSLTGDAALAAAKLKLVLRQFEGARPATLDATQLPKKTKKRSISTKK